MQKFSGGGGGTGSKQENARIFHPGRFEVKHYELAPLYRESAGDRISLRPDRTKAVLKPCKTQQVDRVAGTQEIISSGHRAAGLDEFEIENRPGQLSDKVFLLSRNVAGLKLQL